MRARSDWFLSDWPGGGGRGSGGCGSGLVTYRPVARILSPRPTSLVATPTATPTFTSHDKSSCDNVMTTVTGKPPDGQTGHAVALRRKLSDKDKERRLVRRSSSKRKDKENGGSSDKNGGQV